MKYYPAVNIGELPRKYYCLTWPDVLRVFVNTFQKILLPQLVRMYCELLYQFAGYAVKFCEHLPENIVLHFIQMCCEFL